MVFGWFGLVWFGLKERHKADNGAKRVDHGGGKDTVDNGFD
tara:strand:- start:248 stop:370 length:123 start_codon:yes stop_codon:yes gene_type:complete